MTKIQKIQLIDSDDDVIQIDRAKIVQVKPFEAESEDGCYVASARGVGELEGSIWLNDDFDYVLTEDPPGSICLVVLEKDENL